jgi:hypothetical protein
MILIYSIVGERTLTRGLAMQRWENIILRAQQAYSEKAYAEAITFNRFALSISEMEFEENFNGDDPDKAVSAILVSYLNMMDAYIAIENYMAAVSSFEHAIAFIKITIATADKNPSQTKAVNNGMQYLSREWKAFMHQLAPSEKKVLPGTVNALIERMDEQIGCFYTLPPTLTLH